MPSFGANSYRNVLRFLKSINFPHKIVRRPPRKKGKFVPRRLRKKYQVVERELKGKTIATFQSSKAKSNKHILFLHGGGYVLEMSFGHWSLIDLLASQSKVKITVVDYPLAPEHNSEQIWEWITTMYQQLVNEYPEDDFILMGDSAGGALALALNQKLVLDKSKRLPIQNVLLCPWLDLTMSNPDVKEIVPYDFMLSYEVLAYTASKYAGDKDQKHYLFSPINGDLTSCSPTFVLYGTHELFAADCRKLKGIVQSQNLAFQFSEYPEMQHVWMIIPMPERKKAIDDIINFIKT